MDGIFDELESKLSKTIEEVVRSTMSALKSSIENEIKRLTQKVDNLQCCQVSVFYRNFTDLSWLSSRTTPLGYKRTEIGTPSQPCITSPFKQQTISQSCSHHFLLKYDQ